MVLEYRFCAGDGRDARDPSETSPLRQRLDYPANACHMIVGSSPMLSGMRGTMMFKYWLSAWAGKPPAIPVEIAIVTNA